MGLTEHLDWSIIAQWHNIGTVKAPYSLNGNLLWENYMHTIEELSHFLHEHYKHTL